MMISRRSFAGLTVIVLVAVVALFGAPQVGQGSTPPLPLRASAKVVGTPFTQEITVAIPAGSINATGTPFNVPADRVLQIEFISVSIQTEVGTANTTNFALNTTLDGSTHVHRLLMAKQGIVSGGELFVTGQNVTIYAQGGTAVNATVGRDNNLSFAASATVTVTGRLFEP